MTSVRVLGHQSVIRPRVGKAGAPLSATQREQISALPLADISDKLGRLYTLDSSLRPLHDSMPRLLGTAVTVKLPPGDNWGIHGALSLCKEGDVLVVDWRGYEGGCGTGVSSMIDAVKRGLAGVLVDGGWRDVADIAALGVPVIGRTRTPYSPPKAQLGEINVPVSCGGVVIEPGDVIVGDADGVVAIPRWALEDVIAAVSPTRFRSSVEEFDDDPVAALVQGFATAYWTAFEEANGVRETAEGLK